MLGALAASLAAGGGDGGDGATTAGDVDARAARFASCARQSEYRIARPEPPNERADFLRDEHFTFAEVDLEEQPQLFFSAIVDFFPNRADATRAKGRIASSLAGPSTVQAGSAVVRYTDDPGTPKRGQAEGVVNRCLQR